jgi:NAD(P)-dependent dehydrogenase (short-subunit alcohol dehydrogenase family)
VDARDNGVPADNVGGLPVPRMATLAARTAVQIATKVFGPLTTRASAMSRASDRRGFPRPDRHQLLWLVNLTRAALPVMRRQRSGHIITSSVGGRMGTPGLSAYQSAKWAVGGFTEVLAQEVAPLGIKIVSVEPGGMRTDWGEIARGQVPEILPDYMACQPARSLQCYFQVCGNLTGIPPSRCSAVVDPVRSFTAD